MPQFSGSFVAGLESVVYSTSKDFADTMNTFSAASRLKLTTGTGANQADVFYQKVITLAGSGTIAIDLNGGTNDALNVNIAMLTIVGILIINKDTNGVNGAATLTIGGGANPINGLFGANTQQLKLPPGGTVQMFCGEVGGIAIITATTADILNITNGAAGSSTFQIFIIGRSI
jgi:hypothetical protein